MTSEVQEEGVVGIEVKEVTQGKIGRVIIDPIKEIRKLFLRLHLVQFNYILTTSN